MSLFNFPPEIEYLLCIERAPDVPATRVRMSGHEFFGAGLVVA
ncbi:hypothetical protein ACFPH6_32530 [Streptomyces xiangluensis]|uniref:Uncharacterized protein n=1 Tax=Streptomyces xiangluensis TaxID=2665720 RepID=A0ABV8YYS0_9ACTN